MFEKVNPMHPDKIADRIAGAIVDLAYTKNENPKVAVEVLIGHGNCHIINETSETFTQEEIEKIVHRISRDSSIKVDYKEYKQDAILAINQIGGLRCGDNGIFKGVHVSIEERRLVSLAKMIYHFFPYDGKYLFDIDNKKVTFCQSNATKEDILKVLRNMDVLEKLSKGEIIINPLGNWKGGLNVDTGATNRKLGSDMGRCVTGGGLHGKDLSKTDVSVNIYAFLLAQGTGEDIELSCSIGDEEIDGKPYEEIVKIARRFVNEHGGFEKLAEWGLIY